ncbi:endonuclease domain-containing protein [Ottowia sp.]|uniref:endonuclease domain-containing protein n=1 Tax=Ottowia sp. TaxID=1898956 RepID=UPI003A85BA02
MMTVERASDSLSRARERVRVRASELRTNATEAESLLWHHLRDRRLGGFKFRRQRPIGPYFADFACIEAQLVIELDGGQYVEQAAADAQRTRFIEQQDFRVLRFWNHEVLTETEAVLERIVQACQNSPTLTPTLSRARERGQDTEGHRS